MAKYKLIQGTIPQIFAKEEIPYEIYSMVSHSSPYFQRINQLLLDLNRVQFVNTSTHTIDDFIALWLSNQTSNAYAQGNIDARVLGMLGNMYVVRELSKFNPRFSQNDSPSGFSSFHFGYVDDEGYPCGVAIDYLPHEKTMWMGIIIRKTNAEPHDREATVIIHEEMVNNKENLQESTAVIEPFLNSLHSKAVRQLLEGKATLKKGSIEGPIDPGSSSGTQPIFFPEGRIAANKLTELQAEVAGLTATQQSRIADLVKLSGQQDEDEQDERKKYYYAYIKDQAEIEGNIGGKQEELKKQRDSLEEQKNRKKNKPSFIKRNALSLGALSLAILTLIGLSLILSGLIVPWLIPTITIGGGLGWIAYVIGGFIASSFATLGMSLFNIFGKEKKLTTSQQKLEQKLAATEEAFLNLEIEKQNKINDLNRTLPGRVALKLQEECNAALLGNWNSPRPGPSKDIDSLREEHSSLSSSTELSDGISSLGNSFDSEKSQKEKLPRSTLFRKRSDEDSKVNDHPPTGEEEKGPKSSNRT